VKWRKNNYSKMSSARHIEACASYKTTSRTPNTVAFVDHVREAQGNLANPMLQRGQMSDEGDAERSHKMYVGHHCRHIPIFQQNVGEATASMIESLHLRRWSLRVVTADHHHLLHLQRTCEARSKPSSHVEAQALTVA